MKNATPQRLPDGSFPPYVYGLAGIMEMFGVCKQTAVTLKKGVLSPAVKQQGKVIVTDTQKAFEVFGQKKKRRNG